jgi:hypothetical protein
VLSAQKGEEYEYLGLKIWGALQVPVSPDDDGKYLQAVLVYDVNNVTFYKLSGSSRFSFFDTFYSMLFFSI